MPALVTLVNGTVPVANDFNGNFTALNNALGSSTSISAWAVGELPYASGVNTLSRLTPGTAGTVLTMGASLPAWSNPGAYDQLTGLGLANNAGNPNTQIDIAVGAAASDDAVIANRIFMSLTSGLTKQLDAVWAVGTNQGMRASGAAIADTTYHIFVIERPDTGVVDIAADTSVTGANITANTNAAYTKRRNIGSIIRSSGAILAFTQDADYFRLSATVLDVNATNPGTAAVTRTLTVPLGKNVQALVMCGVLVTTGGIETFALLSDLAATDEVAGGFDNASAFGASALSAGAGAAGPVAIRTNTSAQIRSRMSFSDGTVILKLRTIGWIDRRGRG